MRWCLWWLLAAVPATGWASGLVGRTVPPYPDGLQDIGGSCLSDSSDYDRVCDYSIGLLAEAADDADAEPAPRYIVAARLAGRDGQQALWEITDAQPYPKVGEQFHLQTGSCRVDGHDDGMLAAVVRQDPAHEFLTEVAWARRLDLASGKFVPAAGKVDCINEAYFGL